MATDPRVVRSRARVLDSVVELLAERGVAGTTVDAIVERSGVARTTLYRHWPTRADVLLAAFEASIEAPGPPDLGSLRADLRALVGGLCEALGSSPWAALVPTLVDAAERDPQFAAVHHRFAAARSEPLREVVRRGVARDELPGDVDVEQVVELVSGPVFYRRLVAGAPVDRAYGEALVDRVLLAYAVDPA